MIVFLFQINNLEGEVLITYTCIQFLALVSGLAFHFIPCAGHKASEKHGANFCGLLSIHVIIQRESDPCKQTHFNVMTV